MEHAQTGHARSSTSISIRLKAVPAGQRYAMVVPSCFSRRSMCTAKSPPQHKHALQGKVILAFRRIVLKELRAATGRALPGKALVVYEPALGVVTDVFPCENGHAQERSLFGAVLDT